MRCPNCATENTENSKFCMTCGTPLGASPVEAAPQALPEPPVHQPSAPSPPPPPGPPVVEQRAVTDESSSNPWLSQGAEPAPRPVVEPAVPVETPAPAVAPEAPAEPMSDFGPADPHGLQAHLLSMSEATRPHAEIPMLLSAQLLDDAETVLVAVPGLIGDVVGVAVVTDRRVLLVNGRRWNPVVEEFRLEPGLTVEGWQETDTAMLTFVADRIVRISKIVDKSLAFEAARVVREKVAAAPG